MIVSLLATARTRHRTASTMLVFWLFAVASGLANACLSQPGQTHLHGWAASLPLEVRASMVSPGHLGADADHPENAGTAKGACLKFCGDGAQAIVKLTAGIDHLDLPMAPRWALAWTTRQAAAAPTSTWQELPAPSPGLPLRTRFARLAL